MSCCYCSVAKSCLTLCKPTNYSTPGSSVLHYLPELLKFMFIELVMLSNHLILSPPSYFAFSLSQHQDLFQWVNFALGGQSIGASASASVLPVNIQGWFPLGLTGLISLLSKGLSSIFSSTTIQKQQFFDSQPSSWFNSHICMWLLGKP